MQIQMHSHVLFTPLINMGHRTTLWQSRDDGDDISLSCTVGSDVHLRSISAGVFKFMHTVIMFLGDQINWSLTCKCQSAPMLHHPSLHSLEQRSSLYTIFTTVRNAQASSNKLTQSYKQLEHFQLSFRANQAKGMCSLIPTHKPATHRVLNWQ